MPKIELNKKYNSLQISENGDKWTDFEGFLGSEVELFLKDKLEDSVVKFKYQPSGFTTPDTNVALTNALVGYNAFGRIVCYELVINADPTYTIDFEFKQITVGTNNYQAGEGTSIPIQINKTDDLSVKTTFKYVLTGNLAGNTFNETSAQSITFKWFKDIDGHEVDSILSTLTVGITPGEVINVDISPLFKDAFTGRYLGVELIAPNSTTSLVKVFDQPFTLRKLELSYTETPIISSNIINNIKISGTAGESLEDYRLDYLLDGNTIKQYPLAGKGATSENIKIVFDGLTEGAHDLYVRAVSGGGLTSNYIQISFIYLKNEGSELTNAVATVSEVPSLIENCNLTKFFKVITTSFISGDIEIVVLKSSVLSNINSINTIADAKASIYKFKEVSMSLLNTDESLKVDYTSYIEVPGDVDTIEYLKVLVKDGNGERALSYYRVYNGVPNKFTYQTVEIINPDEGSTHLQYTPGEILGFSLITNGNVFTDLSNNLDSSDGLQLESVKDNAGTITMTTFKVSPTSGVFTNAKKLLSSGQSPLHKGAFSIEMMFKTYGINDLEDKILTIGNITLCPKHLFVNHLPYNNTEPHHTVNASRADFRKNTIEHITITYDPEYKPSTYDLLYDKFFTVGSTSYTNSAKTYPCLKIYVNGTINRIISLGYAAIGGEGDFKFQIHPSNSNINFYIFRTYDKTLSLSEVLKNYTSSMSRLNDKKNYYSDNNILYLNTDFSASQVDSKRNILNTISLGKCINKFKSVSNPNKIYKDRKVLLIALPEGKLPPYYGNRKEDEPKATLLVHYPEISTSTGYVPAETSGRLSGGKIKAQGSSAKKYMIHNTSYSKFTFTPESEFTKETPTTYDYYKMPGSDIEIKKLVGKVNYASSMQSHKLGATKLFHDGYIQPESGLNTSWMNGGRKAVLEDEFLYFFVNVPKEDLNSITWDYFREMDADGNKTGNYNFENCYFLGFQTWGSAKGDEPTSGYDDSVPYYLMLEGADNDNSAANFKTPWASMLIWGNYKGGTDWVSADSTFIETPSSTPTVDKNYYHQFAGGTKDPSTGLWTPEYINGLLIKDETIVFDPGTESGSSSDKKADAWDVDFGCTEGVGYTEKGKWYLDGEDVDEGTPGAIQALKDNLFWVFEDKAKESLKRFAQFYNLVYTFDFSSLYYIGDDVEIDGNSMEIDGTPIYHRKLIFGDNCTINYNGTKVNPLPGDIYRWEKAWPNTVMANSIAKWVPAGLYHNGKDWESLNIATICNWYNHAAMGHGTYPAEYAFFAKEEYKSLKTIGDNGKYKYIFDDPNVLYSFNGYDDSLGSLLKTLQACMAEAFKIIMYEFTDVEDVSYHQAFIKLVAGTDNRAKNTYFQIVGPIYTNKYTSPINGEVEIVKTTIKDEEGSTKDLLGYVKDGLLYEVTIDGESITETGEIFDVGEAKTKSVYYKNTGNGDFKIRLYQDDLDTIFKTDNNGLLVKPYYLLEPPYNRNLESLWGDLHSGMFYNYDLIFTDKIKDHLSRLLRFATGGEWPDNPSTKFNEYFFTVLKNLPSIAYNHMSEIYYESVQTLWLNNKGTALYDTFSANGGDSWKDFTNNKVYNPVSLSHGSCLEAEIEYLRDRVLLLSTYTNSAKNQTDIGISLDGGSESTLGREVTISTSYTSFILYIYPIINNQISYKTSTSLDYDPLLDYMSWNTEQGRYNQIDLAYNIALPNEALDVSVKFLLSPLTTNSYWTSTDLYRTLHIKQGADTFSSLFTFPNASTVISLDPKYVITPSEGSEINVVDHLESVEHLVLQNATITSSGLDFTGCNRLKTLVLGKTENNLTDSPEDAAPNDINWYAVEFEDVLDSEKTIQLQAGDASLGFELLILPKSNSVEQLILPNCIKTVHINHYPKLRRLEFNAGTELINLTVDGRNSLSTIEYIITNFTGLYTTTLEITNIPSNFWLSETVCRKITTIPNVKIEGTVNIGNGNLLASIDWSTKKMLVEKFGNIETGNVKFNYNKVNFDGSDVIVSAAGTIENSGVAPISITISGNNIPIASDNKHLKIEYNITEYTTVTSTLVYFTDKYTPYLNIVEGSEGSIKVRTRIYYESSKYIDSTTNITIGFYEPKPGDFAYANGTFNSEFDPTLGLVGVVFYTWKYQGTDSDTYDVRVLGANFSSEDQPLAPASYALNKNWSSSNYHETYNELLLDLGLNPSEYYSDVVNRKTSASGQITYNSTSEGFSLYKVLLQDTQELEYQKTYITRANNFIKKIGKSITSVTSLEESGFEKPTIEGRSRFEQVLSDFAGIVKLEKVNGTTHDYEKKECGGSFLYGLYPAFLKALYYTPDVYLTEKGSEYFGIGNWYVPNSLEIERIIYYRINSTISKGANSEDYWNSTTHVGINVSGDELNKLNVFTRNAFENIKLLGNTSSLISSEENGEGEGEGLAYGYEYWSSRPSWINQCNDYYSTCGRDLKHVISPVCRVVLTKSKNS